MLTRLGRFTVRRRKAILVATLLFFVLAAVVGGGVVSKLVAGGFDDTSSPSARAARLLRDRFGQADANVVLVVTAEHGTVRSPRVEDSGRAVATLLGRQRGVDARQIVSFWSLGNAAPLASKNGKQALILAVIPGSDNAVDKVIARVAPILRGEHGAVSVGIGGQAEVFREINVQVQNDLSRAELIALPITLLLLILLFGSLVAAGLPLAIGGLAIVGTFLVLLGVASVTHVSIFALNLTTAMGLGLSIDYSLFIVSRYREELRKGREPHDAVVRTVETAGKTVAFSALTVGVALAAMAVFPLVFLRSFAYAGVGVAIMCAVGAVICLPAMLAVLGARVDSLVLWRHTPKPEGQGAWHRVATFVMRRPVLVGSAVIALLLVLGAPFFNIVIGIPDDRVLPTSASSHQVQDDIRRSFASREGSALQVVAPNLRDTAGTTAKAEITTYARRLSALPGVARVDASTGSYAGGKQVVGPGTLTARFTSRTADGTWLSVVPSVEPDSPQGEALAHRVRDLTAPSAVLVGGPSARLVDSKASLFSKLPLALGIIAIATFFLLFMMFGGILVPIKALVINVLSLSATFGAIVFVFQEGHLSKLLDFTATGSIAATMPILMFCVAFGLSMDYEVFLLSRIKEEHDRTGDNTASVALGLERTGRIVTGAALLISVVFLAFATSGVMFIKMFGLGLALAVLLDAFVIRATLVPAFMRLAGEANWWAPRPLRRFYLRYGIHESAEPDAFDVRSGLASR